MTAPLITASWIDISGATHRQAPARFVTVVVAYQGRETPEIGVTILEDAIGT